MEDQHINISDGKVYNILRSSLKDLSIDNGLCDMCNLNQQLKVQQLAHFVPVREENFNEEIEQYRLAIFFSSYFCFNRKSLYIFSEIDTFKFERDY